MVQFLAFLSMSKVLKHILVLVFTLQIEHKYKVITGNCGKETYYISGSIVHTFLKYLYLDYHSWTTNFHYHSRLFDI